MKLKRCAPEFQAIIEQGYEVIYSPLPTQHAIVATLSCLDDKIALNNRINANLEAQAQAISKSWFVDFEPWGGEQPNGWRNYTLGDIATLNAGGDKPEIFSEKYSTACSVPIYSNGIDNEGLYEFPDSAKVFDESVSVSARGTIGFTCLRQTPYFPIVRLISLIPDLRYLSAKYLYFWIKNTNIRSTGTTQQQLTIPDFRKMDILIPPFEIMKKFTSVADSIFVQIIVNESENTTLAAIRDALLPKLMTGELEVEGRC